MNNRTILIPVFLLVILLTSCIAIPGVGGKLITPSDVIITETRDVGTFKAINFSTVGKINLSQGDSESLTISGSDNLVPLIKTVVSSGTLRIWTEGGVTISPLSRETSLIFTIVVKDLTSLDISGLGEVQSGIFSTPELAIDMSGAGNVQLDQLLTDKLDISVSGVGTLEIAGRATTASVDISGAGTVNAPDLQIQNATIAVPGLGSATVWVTDKLSGSISGAGSVSYYGNPQLQTETSGLGSFKPLGNK